MQQKTKEKFFVFKTIAFELQLQILAILKRLLAVGSQCVKKYP